MEEAIDANIVAAGDNCSRAAVVGGLFGAAKSSLKSGFPLYLLDKMDPKLLEEISQLAMKVSCVLFVFYLALIRFVGFKCSVLITVPFTLSKPYVP